MRTCIKCKAVKSDGEFKPKRLTPSGRMGFSSYCKPCDRTRLRDYQRKFRSENPEAVQRANLKYGHGITQEAYDALLSSQGGRCANLACRRDAAGKRLHIDHDHACCKGVRSCGKCIRGLLCGLCNQGLGQFKDSVELLQGAIDYLTARKRP